LARLEDINLYDSWLKQDAKLLKEIYQMNQLFSM